MYWRGRMAEDDRDYGVARAYYQKLSERYRNYYYGVLARKRLATLPAAPAVTVAALQHVSFGAGARSRSRRSPIRPKTIFTTTAPSCWRTPA